MKLPFRKITLCFQFLIFLIAIAGCNKDDVGPQAGIVADKYVAEPGEEITFTSTSTNLRNYEWDLGNGVTSKKKSVKTTYNTPGAYSVKLKVKDKSGKTNEISIPVYIGKFYLSGMQLGTLNFKDGNGKVWDTDGTGPDLYLNFYNPGYTGSGWFIGNDITQKNLPANLIIYDPVTPITNNTCTITLLDSDPANLLPIRTIKSWQFNPIKEIQKSNKGQGGPVFLPGGYPLVSFNYTIKY